MSEHDQGWEDHLMKEIKQQAELIWDLKMKISELEENLSDANYHASLGG